MLEIDVVLDINVEEIPQMGDDEEYELKETLTIMDVINAIEEFMNQEEEPMPQ